MKKTLIIMILIFSIILEACSKKNDIDTYDVGVVTDNNELENDYKSKMIEKGLEKIGERIYISKSGNKNKEKYLQYISSYIDNDYDLIVATNFQMNDALQSLAAQNEDKQFLIFNSIIDPIMPNVNSVIFKTNESSFLAGYIAGLTTQTFSIGYIGPSSGVLSDFYEYGFKSGLLHAARELKTEIAVKTEYIEDLSDYDRGKEIADNMYDSGIDIIYQTAGYAGVGAIDSAKDHNKYIIGYDMDQSFIAPENILTSTIKNYDVIMENLGLNYMSNSIEKGQKLKVGFSEDAVSITKFNEKSIYSQEIYNKALLLKEKIKNNEISVPFDINSFKEFVDK